MPYARRNNIYDAVIRRMVSEALEAQEQEFAERCVNDSDEQLIAYLRSCAQCLGHTPWRREIAGGELIEQRFGSWEKAIQRANLPSPTTPDKLTAFARYQEETARQKEIYHQKKAAKRQQKEAKRSV